MARRTNRSRSKLTSCAQRARACVRVLYEIARYGTLIAWAESLGHDDIVRFLNTNLNEEKAADKKLSTVALRKGVNRKAAS